MTDAVKVLIVDDHAMFRRGVRAELGAADTVDVVGEAEDVDTAVAAIAADRPDVVLERRARPGDAEEGEPGGVEDEDRSL